MKPFSVNLSKFRKIAHDKKSTVLRGPEGHEIKIAHSALPALMRKQLEGLPMYADGSPDTVSADDTGGVPQTVEGLKKRNSALRDEIDTLNAEQPGAQDRKPVTVNVSQAPTEPPAAVVQPPSNPVSQFAAQPVNAQVRQQPTPAGPKLLSPDKTLNVPAAFELEQSAARQQEKIDAAKGVSAANIEQGYISQQGRLAQERQDIQKKVIAHADDFAKHVQEHPQDPNHYAQSQTSEQKVWNAIGLLAGGFKQGLVGGNNPAMDFINQQIDRDIAAQKERTANKKSVYGAYHELYGDEVATNLAARASMLDIYTHKFQQVAAQLGTPQAQAASDAFRAKAAIERAQILLETSGRVGDLIVGQQPLTQAPAQGGAPGQQSAQAGQAPAPTQSQAAAEPVEPVLGTIARGVSSLLNKGSSQAAEEQEEFSKPKVYQILAPNAQRVVGGMQYSTAADKADYAATTEQLQAAQQAEKVLNGPKGDGVGGLHDLMQQLYKNTGSGSYLGGAGLHTRETAREAIGAIPVAGQAIKGAMDWLPKDRATKEYESGKSALLNDLAIGLKGILAPTDIEKVVKPNLPALGDSPKDVANKERAMANSILKALKTNMIDKKGVYKK